MDADIDCLFVATAGGLALSMSSFARSLGKTLAYLSFDDEYKQVGSMRILCLCCWFPANSQSNNQSINCL